MRQLTFALFISLVFCSAALTAHAQENKTPEQKPAAPETPSDTEKPKNEVEKMISEATKRGDTVLGACIDPVHCGDESGDKIVNLEKGRAVDLRVPVYPAIARAARASGTVVVQLLIDEEGKVMAAVAISGHPLLYGASAKAARESVFTPTKLEGKAVKVTGVIHYNLRRSVSTEVADKKEVEDHAKYLRSEIAENQRQQRQQAFHSACLKQVVRNNKDRARVRH